MANKQPYYHRATILFTATGAIPQEALEEALNDKVADGNHVLYFEVEEYEDPEPGDPADLM